MLHIFFKEYSFEHSNSKILAALLEPNSAQSWPCIGEHCSSKVHVCDISGIYVKNNSHSMAALLVVD